MKILITDRFKNKYYKNLEKYFYLEDFIVFLKNKHHKFINLGNIFKKFKGKIKQVEIRGVTVIIKENTIIPLSIFLKTDKKYGENISWKLEKEKIIFEYNLGTKDIQKGKYEEF